MVGNRDPRPQSCRVTFSIRSPSVVLASALLPVCLGGQATCPDRRHEPSADLYCMTLIPAPGIPDAASGQVWLDIAPSPFSVAVTRDGVHRYRPRVILSGMPHPRDVAPGARVFVAWLTTPLFGEWTRLGVVRNGTTLLPEVSLDKFMIVVSAERTAGGTARTGPLVVRGGSPSTRLQPPDFQELASGVMGLTTADLASLSPADHVHEDHPDGWPTVPMPAGFGMLPAEMLLRPNVAPRRVPVVGQAAMAQSSRVLQLADGDSLELVASVVRKRIHGREYQMYAFNGQVPGPVLKVDRGVSVHVRFVNALDQPSTVHWHGLRLDHRMDGVPHVSQHPVAPGESFDYTLTFPDAGVYWYHPHVREDMQQDLGLSGNIVVGRMPELPPVAREEVLLLDDLLIGADGLIPHGEGYATHALMGRFGNVFLVNGEPRWIAEGRASETIRLWFTNAANTRTFNLSVTNATMRLVAGDLGGFDRMMPVESVVLAPAERYGVDVTLTGEGPALLVNRVQALDHLQGEFISQVDTLGIIAVTPTANVTARLTRTPIISEFATREHRAALAGISRHPEMVLEFGLRTSNLPFITQRMMVLDSAYFHPVEWSGTMAMMNWATTGAQAHWFVRDAISGRENEAARFTVRRGERRVIRLVNLRNTLHAMQHPIHLHGQRFLVLAVNGSPPSARAWKDTVLLPAGGTVDILVEFTNPGQWMLHCHIAEHVESGMMTTFTVED